jgi:cytochrome c-type biogenesis protein CcmE
MRDKLLMGTLLVGAGTFVFVLWGLVGPKAIYSRSTYSVSKFLANPVHDTTVRVRGTLVHGTLCKVDQPCEYRFRIAEYHLPSVGEPPPRQTVPKLSVSYSECLAPDTFREIPGVDVDITVEGELCATCHTFQASQIMTNAGKYKMGPDGGLLAIPREVPDCGS